MMLKARVRNNNPKGLRKLQDQYAGSLRDVVGTGCSLPSQNVDHAAKYSFELFNCVARLSRNCRDWYVTSLWIIFY